MTPAEAFKRLAKRYGNTFFYDNELRPTLYLYDTPIVAVFTKSGTIHLNTGGHSTATTKGRMNEALELIGATFTVQQRDFKWYTWNWQAQEKREFINNAYYRSDGGPATK